MARQGSLVVLSLLVHGALAAVIGGIEVKKSIAATAISVAEQAKKKKEPPPPPPQIEPEPEKKAEKRARRQAPPPPPEAPPSEPQAAPKTISELPDFGLSLSGGIGGEGPAFLPGGSTNGARAPRTPAPAAPRAAKPTATATPAIEDCADAPQKPKPRNVPQPAYTDAARAAGVEGKVRVELTVDENGQVISVRVLSGLGHGLDEAALAAARAATFEPALRCGKPTRATFTISMRFKAV